MAGVLAAALLATSSFSNLAAATHVNYSTEYVHPSNGICMDYAISQTVTSTNLLWALEKFETNYDVVETLFEMARKDSAMVFHPVNGSTNVTESFELSATFCSPIKTVAGREKTVLLATHGLGYDRRYWASSYQPGNYSFAEHALSSGYSVLYYDRLGTGKSQVVSGYKNQGSIQVALLEGLVKLVRGGAFTGTIGVPKNIVLVGHSFGSFSSNALLATQPDLVDGAVLTGIAYPNATDGANVASMWSPEAFALRIANNQSKEFADRDTGYLGFGDIYAHANTFFKYPNYAVSTMEYAQSISQPLAILEFASLASFSLAAAAFKGPVMVTAGENDLLVCGGECTSTYGNGLAEMIFSGSRALELYVHPGSGHGLNFGLNATGFYGQVFGFLEKNF